MKRIVCTRPDGGISIVVPAISVDDPPSFTEAEALQRARANVPSDAVSTRDVEASALPSSRVFRDAWVLSGASIVVDMPRARTIHRERIRQRAAVLIARADADWISAEQNHDNAAKAAALARKLALVAAPNDPAIAAATTPEQLAAVDPVP